MLASAGDPALARAGSRIGGWLDAYPATQRDSLRSRLMSQHAAQHLGAWWELWLYTHFTELGWLVEVEPVIVGGGAPDPRVRPPEGDEVVVEATTCFSGIVDTTRNVRMDRFVIEAPNSVRSDAFSVIFRIRASGDQAPPRRRISERLASWLESLNVNDLPAWPERASPRLSICFDGWDIEVVALAKRASGERAAGPLVLAGPGSGGYADHVPRLRGALERKRRRYPPQTGPFVVAVLLADPGFDDDVTADALIGSTAYRFPRDDSADGCLVRRRDGFWGTPERPAATRVSGVVTANGSMLGSAAHATPRLWHHPHATHPLDADLGFPALATTKNGTGADVGGE